MVQSTTFPQSDINVVVATETTDKPPEIHPRLVEAGFRFIRINPRSKRPAQTKWPTINNYSAYEMLFWTRHPWSYERRKKGVDEKLYDHYEGFGNYAVLCDEGHIVLDIDEDPGLMARVKQAIADGILPKTFAVISGSGKGLHLYYRTEGAPTSIPLSRPGTGINVGHIKGCIGYAIGPGSIHSETRQPYRVLYPEENREVTYIDFATVLQVFSAYIPKKPASEPAQAPKPKPYPYEKFSIDIPIASIAMPDHAVDRGNGEFQGAHPVHGSKGGTNFSINTHKNTWFCHRCQSGGSSLEFLAVEHGIIRCDEAHKGCLRGQKFVDVLEIAENLGYDIRRPPKVAVPPPKIISGESVVVDELPDDLPSTEITVLDGPPRSKKTHWAVQQGIRQRTTTFYAATHSVLEHQIKIFRKLRSTGMLAVHYAGKTDPKTKMCRSHCHGRCKDDCHLYPFDDNKNYLSFQQESKDLLYEKGILTANNVPSGRCPYWTIKMAEPSAHYCFAPVSAYDEISLRDFEVFDEDTCIASFFPASVDLAELSVVSGGNLRIANSFGDDWKGITRFREYLEDETKRPRYKQTLIAIVNVLQQMHDVLKIKNLDWETGDKIRDALNGIDMTIPLVDDATPNDILKVIREHESPKESVSKYAEAILYTHGYKPFRWQGISLRMIANEETTPVRKMHPCKSLIIGSTRAQILAKTQNKSVTHLQLRKFPYADRLIVVGVKKTEKSSFKKVIPDFFQILEEQYDKEERIPVLVITGTKLKAAALQKNQLPKVGKVTTDDNEASIERWLYPSGFATIFYQNSSLARGLDVPMYPITIHHDSNFASPYWLAKLEDAIEVEDEDEEARVWGILDAINSDEATNSILRNSPIDPADHQVRIVFMAEEDFWKIRSSLVEQISTTFVTPEIFQEFVQNTSETIGQKRNLLFGRTVRSGQIKKAMGRGEKTDQNNNPLLTCARSDTSEIFHTPKSIIAVFEKLEAAFLSDFLKGFSREFVTSCERLMHAEISRANKNGSNPSVHSIAKWGTKRRKEYSLEFVQEVLHKMIQNGSLIRLPDDKLVVRDRNLHMVEKDQSIIPTDVEKEVDR